MTCNNGFTAHGAIALPGAQIDGALDFTAAELANHKGVTLRLNDLHALTLILRPATAPGEVQLAHAHVGVLADDPATWPQRLKLQGFVYDSLDESDTVSASDRLGWLRRDRHGYAPQPYEQLAMVYCRAGRDEDTRRVAIAKQRHRRHTLAWPARLGACCSMRWLAMAIAPGLRGCGCSAGCSLARSSTRLPTRSTSP